MQASQDFSVDEKNIRRWKGQRERLFVCAAVRMAFTGPRKGCHHKMEMVLADLVRTQREAALPIMTEVLQAKARELIREPAISLASDQLADFKVSQGWLQKFLKCFGFSLRRRLSTAQKVPGDFEEKLIEFQRYVLRK